MNMANAATVLVGKTVEGEHGSIKEMACSTVSRAGDFNGDGLGDILIGAPFDYWTADGNSVPGRPIQ